MEEYVELLDKDPQVLEDFKIVLLSMFRVFRNPERYEDLKTKFYQNL